MNLSHIFTILFLGELCIFSEVMRLLRARKNHSVLFLNFGMACNCVLFWKL